MAEEQPGYFVYLLRIWQGTGKAQEAWRASLESSPGGERQVFASLSEAFDFLQTLTGAEPAVNQDKGEMERDVRDNEKPPTTLAY
jgi:hypothetical protein